MKIAGLVLVVALLFVATASFAQNAADNENTVLLKLGGFIPFQGEPKDELGSTWYDLGLEYKITSGKRVDHYAGIGWMQPQGKTLTSPSEIAAIAPSFGAIASEAETDMWMIPVTYTQRTRPNPKNKLYVGGGAGAYFSRGKVRFTVPGAVGVTEETFEKSDVSFGVFVIGGAALSDSFRVEAKYTGMLRDTTLGDINGTQWKRELNGLTVSLVGAF